MCGIAGFVAFHAATDVMSLRAIGEAMARAVAHRGPDDADTWADAASGVSLAFRRLSIVDLSQAGRQPMHSHDGRLVMVFNGEIYNVSEVRTALEAVRGRIVWRGHSDTEVLLEAFVTWGIESTLKRVVGMFAIAVWDRESRRLTLARDRIGEKPLYYGTFGSGISTTLVFGSELKALCAHPAFRGEIDRESLTLYARLGCVPGERSIYRGVHKLLPGAWIEFTPERQRAEARIYWSQWQVALQGTLNPSRASEDELAGELDGLLRRAVKAQMQADVPLGAFLSGGIDSSTVVSLMQAQSSKPVHTFTIGFAEAAYNEAEHAKSVAAHLGTQHTELYVTSEHARSVIPLLPHIYDEPFADSSHIPTFLVSQLARRDVTVSLSGDGGDELFGGYYRYHVAQQMLQTLARMPGPLRRLSGGALRAMPVFGWDAMFAVAGPILPERLKVANPGQKIHKFADVIGRATLQSVYERLMSHWSDPEAIVVGGREPVTLLTDHSPIAALGQPLSLMTFLDMVGYLPDYILAKVDRASMAVSLESRMPLLDHRVVEFAWRVPVHMKVRDGQGKVLLKRVLERYVPRALFERQKMGFGVPIDSWLRGPLREWADHLLDPAVLRSQGHFNEAPITRAWREHRSGRGEYHNALWVVLMFQAWLQSLETAKAKVDVHTLPPSTIGGVHGQLAAGQRLH